MKHGKKYRASAEKIVREKAHPVEDAVRLVKEAAKAKFDETVDLVVRLGVDPRHADQQVRGAVGLRHGLGKSKKIAVVVRGEPKQKEAKAAGAELVGAEDLIEQISKGMTDFDILVATPDMMKDLSKLGKVLGPKGLMPNPKSGTVTMDITKTVKELKAGRVEYKVDDYGIIHVPVGKASFPAANIAGNAKTVLDAILKAKPAASKGIYFISVTLASTMGPGFKLEVSDKAAV